METTLEPDKIPIVETGANTTRALVAAAIGILTLAFAAGWLMVRSASDGGRWESEVADLMEAYTVGWDEADGEAVVALMTPDGTHTCPLGHFSIADDGGVRLIAAVQSMEGDDFEVISGPTLSDTEAPLEAVNYVRITSPSIDVTGIARAEIVEHDGALRIASYTFTHL